jgi:uncharacterized protein involved in exopolysaccharide biosynthesis
MDESRKSFDPHVLRETIAKRKWHLVVPLVIAIGTSIVVGRTLPEVYRVESTLLFQTGAPLTGEVERHLLPGTSSPSGRSDERAAEANLLRIRVSSPDFLGELAKEMGFLENPDAIERARVKKLETGDPKTPEEIARQDVIAWLGSLIQVNLAGSSIYQITIEGQNRQLIFALSNMMNTKLLALVQTDQLGRLKAASSFTEEQIVIYKQKLDDARRDLDRFLMSQPLPAMGGPAPSRIDASAAARLADETGYEVVRITDRHDQSVRTLSEMYGLNVGAFVSGAMPSLSPLAEKLRSLEQQLGLLLLERSWTDPTVIAHNSRIGEARREIAESARRLAGSLLPAQPVRVQEIASGVLADQLTMESLAVRRETLQRQTVSDAPVGPSAAVISRRSQEMSFLEEQVRINEEIYNSFLRQATSAKISEAVETEQLTRSMEVIQQPRWPTKPVRPNRGQILGLGVLIGLALGAAAALAGEYLDTSIKDVREAEEILGAPILGTIPMVEYRYQPLSRSRFGRRRLFVGVVGGIVALALAGYVVMRSVSGGGEETPAKENPAEGAGAAPGGEGSGT